MHLPKNVWFEELDLVLDLRYQMLKLVVLAISGFHANPVWMRSIVSAILEAEVFQGYDRLTHSQELHQPAKPRHRSIIEAKSFCWYSLPKRN